MSFKCSCELMPRLWCTGIDPMRAYQLVTRRSSGRGPDLSPEALTALILGIFTLMFLGLAVAGLRYWIQKRKKLRKQKKKMKKQLATTSQLTTTVQLQEFDNVEAKLLPSAPDLRPPEYSSARL
ncbi:hypothetical protein BDZ91DRAFT_761795 [Kalaharituber pfeilii]|nr:hypothetical protein BDZ91DRAFT_761795 [Kalaharituber pfeilii]